MDKYSVWGIKPGLNRIESLLELLSNPHKGLSCLHVAGTNGKGSTSLLVANMLYRAGYKVGRFCSPHLHSYRERLLINEMKIAPDAFIEYLRIIDNKIQALLDKGGEHPTAFEILTAIAMQFFHDNKVDLAVLEVGLGGLYDSTNVITPLVSVITNVDYDHMGVLGYSLEEIAANKAGIIKPGVPVVYGSMPDTARHVIVDTASRLGAPCIEVQIEIECLGEPSLDGQKISISREYKTLPPMWFGLAGDFQLQNLALALTVLQQLEANGYWVEDSVLKTALASVKSQGRLELVLSEPPVIVDAAHNTHAVTALIRSLEKIWPKRSRILVCGLVDDKDAENIIRVLGANSRICVVTRPEGTRGAMWKRVTKVFGRLYPDKTVFEAELISDAVNFALNQCRPEEYILITGSFYVLDQARRILQEGSA